MIVYIVISLIFGTVDVVKYKVNYVDLPGCTCVFQCHHSLTLVVTSETTQSNSLSPSDFRSPHQSTTTVAPKYKVFSSPHPLVLFSALHVVFSAPLSSLLRTLYYTSRRQRLYLQHCPALRRTGE